MAFPGQGPSTVRLDAVFARAGRFADAPDVEADYARYLCILVTGFIEQAVERSISAYVDAQGDQRLSRYIATTFRQGRNMRAREILDIVGRFDENWRSQLNEKLTLRHREAIGSVYASRNKIARGEDVDLPYRQVRDDYKLVREAMGFLQETLL